MLSFRLNASWKILLGISCPAAWIKDYERNFIIVYLAFEIKVRVILAKLIFASLISLYGKKNAQVRKTEQKVELKSTSKSHANQKNCLLVILCTFVNYLFNFYLFSLCLVASNTEHLYLTFCTLKEKSSLVCSVVLFDQDKTLFCRTYKLK